MATAETLPDAGDQPWPRKMTLLAAAGLTVMSGATIAPSLPAIAEHFSGTPNADLLTRLVLTIPALSIAVCAPLAGLIVDRYGRKRLLILATLAYVASGTSGVVLDTLPAILIGRALLGVSVAGVMTAATTLVGDYLSGTARARFLGLQSAFMAFGGVVVLSGGGLLAELHWRGPFFVYLTALFLVPFMVATLYEPERTPQSMPSADSRDPDPAGASASGWRLIALIYAVALATFVAFYMLPVQLPFYLKAMGVPEPSLAGLAIASGALVAAVVSMSYARIRARLSHRSIVALGFALMGVGYGIVAAADSYGVILAAMVMNGLGMGSVMPNLSVWLMARAPAALRGRAVGGLSASIFLGQFLSPLAVEPIAGPFGLATAYAVVGGLLILAAIGFAIHATLFPRAAGG